MKGKKIMKRFKYILTLVLCASMALSLSAQSDSFKAGKNLNVQFSILKELQRSYVDTVQMDELVLDGSNALKIRSLHYLCTRGE